MGIKRTNIEIDEKLIHDCFNVTRIKTRKALIDYALREVLRHEKQSKIIELKGNINWIGDLDDWRQGRDL